MLLDSCSELVFQVWRPTPSHVTKVTNQGRWWQMPSLDESVVAIACWAFSAAPHTSLLCHPFKIQIISKEFWGLTGLSQWIEWAIAKTNNLSLHRMIYSELITQLSRMTNTKSNIHHYELQSSFMGIIMNFEPRSSLWPVSSNLQKQNIAWPVYDLSWL